jgi:hypothetical protein
MPRWIKSTYFWLVGRKYPADNLMVYEDYRTGKKRIQMLPDNAFRELQLMHQVGYLKNFIKYKAEIKKRTHEKLKIQ